MSSKTKKKGRSSNDALAWLMLGGFTILALSIFAASAWNRIGNIDRLVAKEGFDERMDLQQQWLVDQVTELGEKFSDDNNKRLEEFNKRNDQRADGFREMVNKDIVKYFGDAMDSITDRLEVVESGMAQARNMQRMPAGNQSWSGPSDAELRGSAPNVIERYDPLESIVQPGSSPARPAPQDRDVENQRIRTEAQEQGSQE